MSHRISMDMTQVKRSDEHCMCIHPGPSSTPRSAYIVCARLRKLRHAHTYRVFSRYIHDDTYNRTFSNFPNITLGYPPSLTGSLGHQYFYPKWVCDPLCTWSPTRIARSLTRPKEPISIASRSLAVTVDVDETILETWTMSIPMLVIPIPSA